jgi:hypothetical protein
MKISEVLSLAIYKDEIVYVDSKQEGEMNIEAGDVYMFKLE